MVETIVRTAVHAYTAIWDDGKWANGNTRWGNAHFATSHGGPGSRMLSTSHPPLERFYERPVLARQLVEWRTMARSGTLTLIRETVGYI